MSGYIGPLPVPQGIQRKQSFTATASQTTFNTNGYTDGDFINVYLNGVRLINGTDYTATNGSDIVLTTGASASDVLDFETFQTFQLVDQQFENVTLKNPTHEDTDGGRESTLIFKGEQSGGEISTLAEIEASHDGTADDQKGDLIFKTNDGSDNDAPTERMRLDSSGNVGIGVSSPSYTLTVQKDVDDYIAKLENDGNSTSSNGLWVDTRWNTATNTLFKVTTNSGGTDVITAKGDGNVGIGTNNPQYGRLHIADDNSDIAMDANGSGQLHIDGNGYTFGLALNASGAQLYTNSASRDIIFGVNETEIMRVTDGELVVGDTAEIRGSGQDGVSVEPEGRIYLSRGTGTGGFNHLVFYNGNGQVGSVTTSGSSTAYNTSSDYRLKENVTDVTDGITRVKQLAPKRFNFIADADKTVDGFIAHEAATVVPEAVTGTKDAMRDEEYEVSAATGDVYTPATEEAEEVIHSSNVEKPETLEDGQQWRETTAAVMGTRSVPDYQGIDQSKLVPLLTAALQEAIAKIETLETQNTTQATQIADLITRVTALEAE